MTQISLAVHFINRFLFLFSLVMRYIPSSSQLLWCVNVSMCYFCFVQRREIKIRSAHNAHAFKHTGTSTRTQSLRCHFRIEFICIRSGSLPFSISLSPACTRLLLYFKAGESHIIRRQYSSAEWVYTLCDIGSASMVNELALKQQ